MRTEEQVLIAMFEALIPWYEAHKRELPWRQDKEPYHVWLSEIMLQQTRVEAVKEYYRRFLTTLPTIADLAEAPEEQILKLWEGLGYYNRVRNLQKAAQTICADYAGVFPSEYAQIRSLSGIGDYTAGAIASICFDAPTPAVDGNVLRVYSRLLADDANIDLQTTKKRITGKLQETYPRKNPGIATQALMELGATVCVPNGAPRCDVCPVAEICQARKQDTWRDLPVRSEKKKRKIVDKTVFILLTEDTVALHKRSASGLLAGMWEFPNVDAKLDKQEAVTQVTGWQTEPVDLLMQTSYTHIFSHVEWHMTAYYIRCRKTNKKWKWVTKESLDETYALPSAFRPFREQIEHL
ncbi:MAG: A/G-specific adenine glycosylase [Clostridium sp.]|nr:A/G-specific adenine glycosylase [Clostridium sp.]